MGGWRAHLEGLWRRRRIEREADEELQFHIEMETRANEARGASRDEARRAALRDLGGAAQTREAVRDVRTLWVDAVWRDLRYGLRRLGRQPAFATAAIVTLGLGIGANTAIFSIVDTTVLRPLPYDGAERLVQVSVRDPQRDVTSRGIGPRDFLDWREQQRVFEQVTAHFTRGGVLLGDGEPQEVQLGLVTAGFFEVLRTSPEAGRGFVPADEEQGRNEIAVLTHRFWRARFGSDVAVLGRRLQISGVAYEVVGILPEGFEYPADGGADIFIPLWFSAAERQHGVMQAMVYTCIGRLRDGITVSGAAADMTRVQSAMAPRQGAYGRRFSVVELTPLLERHVGSSRPLMLMLLGAVALVLLIACANVSDLILANGTTRVQELTVRAALGASGGRLARQLLVETLLLAGIGALLGVAVAWWGVGALRQVIPPAIPRGAAIGIDLRVLAFTAGATVFCGVLCALLPAWQARRVDLVTGVKEAAGGTHRPGRLRMRRAIALAEIALAVMLLVGAGLFITSFARLTRTDPGFDASRVLTLRLSVPRLPGAAPRAPEMLAEMVEAVRRTPGVEAAALASSGGALHATGDVAEYAGPHRGTGGAGAVGRRPGASNRRARILRRAPGAASTRPAVRGDRPQGRAAGRGDQRIRGAALLARGRSRRHPPPHR